MFEFIICSFRGQNKKRQISAWYKTMFPNIENSPVTLQWAHPRKIKMPNHLGYQKVDSYAMLQVKVGDLYSFFQLF